jgi:YVTN family beta-propeller protein
MRSIKNLLTVCLWGAFFSLLFLIGYFLLFDRTIFHVSATPMNIYANTQAGMISTSIRNDPFRVYVPNSFSNTVSVIDPYTYKVVDTFKSGKNPQHIAPSYDLRTLFVLNNLGNSLTPINPQTGKPGPNIPVGDPYNLYFTPDGRFAIVIAEAAKRIDFRDAKTMQLVESVPVLCKGLNHLDYTADGRYALMSCEFSGTLIQLDVANRKVVKYFTTDSCTKSHSMPQDVRLSPDGRTFYVADMMLDGVFLVDAKRFSCMGYIATGIGTHSVYPSRNSRFIYVGNRGCHSVTRCKPHGPGSVSVIDPVTQKVVARWPVPGGGSPDMGNITPDGKELWLAGRYDGEVYVFDTQTGNMTHRIKVGQGPHGLTVWPQPGRFSLGHTGNMR